MSGYYPATHDFDNEIDGTMGVDIDIVDVDGSTGGSKCWIISDFNGHNKVIELQDRSSSERASFDSLWDSNQPYGSSEWWTAISDASQVTYHTINDASMNSVFSVRIYGDVWTALFGYLDPTWYPIPGAPAPQDNTWYHVRMDFECTTGNYSGLDQWTYFAWIDGIRYGPFDFYQHYQPAIMSIATRNQQSNYNSYIDAVGYSWDPDYNIGDNWKEGLLLKYENTTNLDWMEYSLDNQTNKTIMGNTTIPMPADGLHRVQVFGNDSVGTMFESNMRYFTVATSPPEITINSPTPSQTIGSTAPSYDISITGLYDSIWYTLDGGATNHTASSLTGTINQAAWTALTDGIITISFFANNSAGIEESAQVQVIKDSSEEPPSGIPGYDLYLLLGALGVISALIVRRRVKS